MGRRKLEGSRGDRMMLGRLMAGLELLERSGVSTVEVAYDDEVPGPETVLWHAEGRWKGTRVFSRQFPYPAPAVDDLLARVINGGRCLRCERTTIFAVVDAAGAYCAFQLTAGDLDDDGSYRWVRTCEDPTLAGAAPVLARGLELGLDGRRFEVTGWQQRASHLKAYLTEVPG